MASDKIKTLGDGDFDQAVQSGVVLVDFWAEWCGPCKAIAPLLDQIATEYQGRLRIAKVDVDSNQATAMRYGVRSIPTLMLFRNGVVEAQQVGLLSKDNLKKLLDAKL